MATPTATCRVVSVAAEASPDSEIEAARISAMLTASQSVFGTKQLPDPEREHNAESCGQLGHDEDYQLCVILKAPDWCVQRRVSIAPVAAECVAPPPPCGLAVRRSRQCQCCRTVARRISSISFRMLSITRQPCSKKRCLWSLVIGEAYAIGSAVSLRPLGTEFGGFKHVTVAAQASSRAPSNY
jgi:hypothetical protein